MRVSEWLKNDPVILHKTLKKYNIKIPKSDFILLISKLRNNHFEYYRDFMRLKLKIKFGGYENDVEAIVPYKDKPIDFYKWWCKDKTRVKMSTPEKVQLFDKVHNINSSILTSEDKKFIGK